MSQSYYQSGVPSTSDRLYKTPSATQKKPVFFTYSTHDAHLFKFSKAAVYDKIRIYNFISIRIIFREGDMYKLLVVDDEVKIRDVIREYAEFNGYEVAEAGDGMEAVRMCKDDDFDLIILDIMMPKLDGFSTCKEIKKFKPDIPVIMLSARGEEYDKLFGFELGIDDYVVKPFSPKELMARVNAVLSRRSAAQPKTEDILKFKGLEINIPARTVSVDGEKIELTPKEYDLLFYLIQNKGIALSRSRLLSDIWGYDFFGDDRTIDTHVKNLRNSLGPYRDFIETIRGVGYKFEVNE